MAIVIHPFEGAVCTANWAWHLKNNGGAGGEDYRTGRVHTVLSPVSGTVTYVGGTYNEVVIKMADGRSVRIAENGRVLVSKGQKVDIFQPVAADALLRGGVYRDTHFNGVAANGTRIPFSGMVTHTQAAAKIALAPAALTGTQRKVGSVLVKRRSQPTSKSAVAGEPLEANEVGNFNGWIYGENVSGNPVWFRGISGHWFWSGGFVDKGTHDLADLNPIAPPVQLPQEPVIEPTPEPEPVPPVVVPEPEVPAVPEPTEPETVPSPEVPVEPPVVETPSTPEPTTPTTPVKPAIGAGGWIAGVILLITAAVAAIINLFN